MVSVRRRSSQISKEKVPEMDPISSSDSSDDVSEAMNEEDIVENDEKSFVVDVNDDSSTTKALNDLVRMLSKPGDLIHSLLLPTTTTAQNDTNKPNNNNNNDNSEQVKMLLSISKTLFSRMEKMAYLQEQIITKKPKGEEKTIDTDMEEEQDICPLSGISHLYTGEEEETTDETSGGASTTNVLDAETIWGQVDLQNEALFARLRKNIRKLEKKMEKKSVDEIRLINLGENSEDEEQSDSGDDTSSNDDQDDVHSDGEEKEDDDDGDEEAKRIKERMERTMMNMDEDDDDDDEDGESSSIEEEETNKNESIKFSKKPTGKAQPIEEEEEDLEDPAAEELNDGFFSLHDMEDFADEEEEMLPDDAYGQIEEDDVKKNNEKKKELPHLKARAGDIQSDDSDDDDEFNELEKNASSENTVRRRRYREDDEVDALLSLYENVDENDQSDEDDVVNMTSVDFFGQPEAKYLKGGKKETNTQKVTGKANNTKSKSTKNNDDDDDDSWDDYNFQEGSDWKDGDKKDKKEGEEEKNRSADENDSSSEEEEEENVEDGNEEIEENPSNFKIHAKKLEKVTEEMESEILGAKPWQMVGESKSTERPTNSLLEKTPQFEVASKMAPLVTAEFTAEIENIIKKRILEEDWDDVIPRELPDIGLNKRNGELPEVSQEKSKLGLGELYEREYLKKVTGYDKDVEEKQSKEDKLKSELKGIFANLCSKLDALSNYHFAPRPVADEADAKALTTPAIAMEEALPTFVSDSRAVAPEEVYGQKIGRESVIRADSEMDQTDRKKLRQAKKSVRRKKRAHKLADEKLISRLQPGLGLNNPYEKRKMREELQMARASGKVTTGERDKHQDYTTSAKFFERMQTNVQQSIKDDADGDGRQNKKQRTLQDGQSAGSFKL